MSITRRPLIIGSPELPGNAMDMRAVQEWTIRRKYSKGYNFTTVTPSNTFQNIGFPGTARKLLGFSVFDTSKDPLNLITININNEDIVTDISWVELCKVNQFVNAAGQVSGTSFKDEYYRYERLLSGKDSVKITYKANTAGQLFVTFHFITDPEA